MSKDNEIQTTDAQAPAAAGYFEQFSPRNLEEAMEVCRMLAKGSMVPKDYVGKPDAVFSAALLGGRFGFNPIQACQHIAVVNGKPSMYGDAVLGVVQASGKLDWIKESDNGTEAICEVKRIGSPNVIVRTFSNEDARNANLLGKAGPWTQYPARMRQMRARAFALRDGFADVLIGISVAEEAQDIPAPKEMGQAEVVTTDTPEPVSKAAGIKAKIAPAEPEGATDLTPSNASEPPAGASTPEDVEKVAADFLLAIGEAESLEALGKIGESIKKASAEVQKAVRPVYSAKGREFTDAAKGGAA